MLLALELALAEDFSDRAAHLACADWLCERGEPQGGLIQVQLELEQPDVAPQRLAHLLSAEALLVREVFPLCTSVGFAQHRLRVKRGWLTDAHFTGLSPESAQALTATPGVQLLSSLVVERFQGDVRSICRVLSQAPFLAALRSLALLDLYPMTWPVRDDLAALVARMPRLTELSLGETNSLETFLQIVPASVRTLRLRVRRPEDLQAMYLCRPLPDIESLVLTAVHSGLNLQHEIEAGLLARLFTPARWPNLRHLAMQGLALGDEGCAALAQSGILRQLRSLTFENAGIRTGRPLYESPGIEELELLDLG
jgi:uncharacterized protein (TIGR02996 family)